MTWQLMTFEIHYKVGQSTRVTWITAKNLDQAEEKANKQYPNWQDIYLVKEESSNE